MNEITYKKPSKIAKIMVGIFLFILAVAFAYPDIITLIKLFYSDWN